MNSLVSALMLLVGGARYYSALQIILSSAQSVKVIVLVNYRVSNRVLFSTWAETLDRGGWSLRLHPMTG